jgi:hypothetical protein
MSKRPKKNYTGIEGRIMDPVARSAAQRLAQQARVATNLDHNSLQVLSDNRHSDQQVDENASGPALSLVEVTAPPLQPQSTPEPDDDENSDISESPRRTSRLSHFRPPSSSSETLATQPLSSSSPRRSQISHFRPLLSSTSETLASQSSSSSETLASQPQALSFSVTLASQLLAREKKRKRTSTESQPVPSSSKKARGTG